MKKLKGILLLLTLAFALTSCGSTKIERVDADSAIDLSGYWNDTDIRIVTDSLIDECIVSRAVSNFKKENDRLARVKLGTIRNLSDEHIDTTIIANKFRNSIVNSGVLKFVSSDDELDYLRDERLNQEDYTNLETQASMGNETGADFLLLGTIKTVTDVLDNRMVKTYYVDVELHDIETSEILWTSENSDIKKVITRKKAKF